MHSLATIIAQASEGFEMTTKIECKALDIYCYENCGDLDPIQISDRMIATMKSNSIICVRYYRDEIHNHSQRMNLFRRKLRVSLVNAITHYLPGAHDSAELSNYLENTLQPYSKHSNSKISFYQIEVDIERSGNSVNIKQK